MLAPIVLSNHGMRHSGGIERYLLTLVRGLHERGIRPTVVAKRFDRAIEEYAWVDAVPINVKAVPGKLRDAWFDWRLRALKARRGWFPVVALNQTAAADIAICGSNHPAHLAAMGLPVGWWDRRKIALERAHLENAQVIVAHSHLLAEQVVLHYGIAPDKIEVAYPPVDEQRFRSVDPAQRQRQRAALGLRADQAVFLLVSTGHARKGLDLAVRALRGQQNAILAVVGRPPGITAPHLRYLGYRADMESVYPAVDCTLITSRYEPFGLVGVESVLCGTPVIAARNVGCAEVLSERAATRFDIDNTHSLTTAIDSALARWRDSSLRLSEPHAELGYAPSVQSHLDILLRWVDRLRNPQANAVQTA